MCEGQKLVSFKILTLSLIWPSKINIQKLINFLKGTIFGPSIPVKSLPDTLALPTYVTTYDNT